MGGGDANIQNALKVLFRTLPFKVHKYSAWSFTTKAIRKLSKINHKFLQV